MKYVGTVLLKSEEAATSGLSALNWKPGTRGITKARVMPTLKHSQAIKTTDKHSRTYATQNAKRNHAVNFRVKYLPHRPRSPRLHSFNFCALRSALASFTARFLFAPISSAFHSGPNAGTVTISTGPAPLGVFSIFIKVGEFTGRYLNPEGGQYHIPSLA